MIHHEEINKEFSTMYLRDGQIMTESEGSISSIKDQFLSTKT